MRQEKGVTYTVTEGDLTGAVSTQCNAQMMCVEVCTSNLYNFIHQCHLNKINLYKKIVPWVAGGLTGCPCMSHCSCRSV